MDSTFLMGVPLVIKAADDVDKDLNYFALIMGVGTSSILALVFFLATIAIAYNYIRIRKQGNHVQVLYDIILFVEFSLRSLLFVLFILGSCVEIFGLLRHKDTGKVQTVLQTMNNTLMAICYNLIIALFLVYLYFWLVFTFEVRNAKLNKYLALLLKIVFSIFCVLSTVIGIFSFIITGLLDLLDRQSAMHPRNKFIDGFDLNMGFFYNVWTSCIFFVLALAYIVIGWRIYYIVRYHSFFSSSKKNKWKIIAVTLICSMAFISRSLLEIFFFFVNNEYILGKVMFFMDEKYIGPFIDLLIYCLIYPVYFILLEITPFMLIMVIFSFRTKISVSVDVERGFSPHKTYIKVEDIEDDDSDFDG